jgi:HlyD family secretion protein
MNMKKKSSLLIAVLLIAGIAGGGVWYVQSRASQDPEKRYRIAEVVRGEVIQAVSANGTLNPVVLVSVGTQVSGTVKKLYVDFNDKVKAGQALLELDDALVSASERQSAANVLSARASLDLAQANEQRMKALLAEEYVSKQEYEQTAQVLKSARAQLTQAQAQNARDQANLGFTVIRSPVDGVVIDRVVDLGQTVAASFQTPTLIKIAQDLSEMRIDTSFAEADIGAIREGQKARFTVDAFPSRNFDGVVQQIRLNPTTQQNVVTYNVLISVANPEQILLPGMTAYVTIGVQQRKDALLVPNAALRFKPADAAPAKSAAAPAAAAGGPQATPGAGKGRARGAQGATVYVLEDGQLKAVAVQLGITDSRNTEVVGGDLAPGARIVVGENGTPAKAPSSVGMRMF